MKKEKLIEIRKSEVEFIKRNLIDFLDANKEDFICSEIQSFEKFIEILNGKRFTILLDE